MAKTKKSARPKLNSVAKRNLFVVGVLLICVGILLFVMDSKKQKATEFMLAAPEPFAINDPSIISPSEGCKLIATNYICDIKVSNTSNSVLEWSSAISDLEGASLSTGGSGSVPAGGSTIVQLLVPKQLCDTTPDALGKVLILDDAKSSNQVEATFSCAPPSSIPTGF